MFHLGTMNVYCDESCHLENDGFDIMVLGTIFCNSEHKNTITNEIRNIKIKHSLSSWNEIKWTKVSNSKLDFYKELISYFFNNKNLSFRCVVARDKSKLDNSIYNNNDYNLWYYKMYFQLLNKIIHPYYHYNINIDIKDTIGGKRVTKLKDVLCNNIYDFKGDIIKNINQIRSNESEILQLTDLLIGAISYYHRNLYMSNNSSPAKNALVNDIISLSGINLNIGTKPNNDKMDIFIWEPR